MNDWPYHLFLSVLAKRNLQGVLFLLGKMGSKMNAYDDKEHTLLNMHSSEDGSAQQTQTEISEKFCRSDRLPPKVNQLFYSAGRSVE